MRFWDKTWYCGPRLVHFSLRNLDDGTPLDYISLSTNTNLRELSVFFCEEHTDIPTSLIETITSRCLSRLSLFGITFKPDYFPVIEGWDELEQLLEQPEIQQSLEEIEFNYHVYEDRENPRLRGIRTGLFSKATSRGLVKKLERVQARDRWTRGITTDAVAFTPMYYPHFDPPWKSSFRGLRPGVALCLDQKAWAQSDLVSEVTGVCGVNDSAIG